METILPQKANAAAYAKVRAQGELFMLVTALDELRQGRFLEVADILASRWRALSYFAQKGNWEIAQEFLSYQEEAQSLVSKGMEDAAARLVEDRHKRQRRIGKAGN